MNSRWILLPALLVAASPVWAAEAGADSPDSSATSAVLMKLVQRNLGERWSLRTSAGGVLCRLPCQQWVEPRGTYRLVEENPHLYGGDLSFDVPAAAFAGLQGGDVQAFRVRGAWPDDFFMHPAWLLAAVPLTPLAGWVGFIAGAGLAFQYLGLNPLILIPGVILALVMAAPVIAWEVAILQRWLTPKLQRIDAAQLPPELRDTALPRASIEIPVAAFW